MRRPMSTILTVVIMVIICSMMILWLRFIYSLTFRIVVASLPTMMRMRVPFPSPIASIVAILRIRVMWVRTPSFTTTFVVATTLTMFMTFLAAFIFVMFLRAWALMFSLISLGFSFICQLTLRVIADLSFLYRGLLRSRTLSSHLFRLFINLTFNILLAFDHLFIFINNRK